MKNKHSLLILIPGFPADESDTDCVRFPQQCIYHLAKQYPGWDITVFTFQYPYEPRHYVWHGIQVYAFGGKNKGKIRRLMLWNEVLKQAQRHHTMSAFTGILSFWLGECALIGSRLSRRFNIPHFTYLLGQDVRKGNKYVSWIKPPPGSLIAISDQVRDECQTNYHLLPAHVIPLGIDPDEYPGTVFRDVDLLGVGSLIPLKRFDIFIEIAARIKRTKPGLRAVICGDGPLRGLLEKQVVSSGLAENILFTGKYPHNRVIELMSRAKLLFHPSAYEGFSTVCAEALYAGSHVVAFRKPMHTAIAHFHVAENTDEANDLITALLIDSQDHNPVLFQHIHDTVHKLAELFITKVLHESPATQHTPVSQLKQEIETGQHIQ